MPKDPVLLLPLQISRYSSITVYARGRRTVRLLTAKRAVRLVVGHISTPCELFKATDDFAMLGG